MDLRHLGAVGKRLAVAVDAGRVSINGGAIIDHEAPRERRFVAAEK
jgi:hypothetical protein